MLDAHRTLSKNNKTTVFMRILTKNAFPSTAAKLDSRKTLSVDAVCCFSTY